MGALPKELRLALCMRGGVSLAVWMGGACREIATLRSALGDGPAPADDCDAAQRKIYRFLLERSGYDEVTVDILTGTSAGGLNGVLFASHLMYGMPFDSRIRDIWLQLGDLEGLTRRPDEPTPPSLLEGNGFHRKVLEQLDRLVGGCEPAAPPAMLRLILTATRLHPRNEYLRTSLGTPMLVNWSRAHMVFRHHGIGTADAIFTDFSADDRNATLDRLAYAARTTSSFPVAFEPAEVAVVKPADAAERNFHGLISETCAPDPGGAGRVQLMDGGVLDNVPLAWAIRAIAGAAANQSVDRWLLYLEPVPPSPPAQPADGTRSLARLVGVIRALLQAKANSESLLEDATELREAWTNAQRLHGATGGIPGDPAFAHLPDPSAHDRKRYAEAVACVEADRLARLIEDPISLVGPDPLPIPDTSAFAGAEPWPLLADLRGPVDTNLAAADSSFRSPLVGARAVALALDWVHAVEETVDAPPEALRDARQSLYQARFACEVLLAARDRLLLRIGDPGREVDGWVAEADRWLGRFVQDAGGLGDCGVDMLAEVAHRAVHDDLGTPPAGSAEPFSNAVLDHVARTCVALRAALAGEATAPGFRALTEASDAVAMRKVLTYAELVLGPLRPDPLAEPTRIRLHTVNAAAHSPLEGLLFGGAPEPEHLVDRKLSGNTLMNFASFLSSRWRLNDWTWGRMDAASALVDVVARTERAHTGQTDTGRVGAGQTDTGQANTGRADAADLVTRLRDLHAVLVADHPELAALIGAFPDDVDADNVAERLPGLLKTWLHWNVLRQEIPLLKALDEAGHNRDLPPAPKVMQQAAQYTAADCAVLAEVGGESVRDLLTRSSLRRAAMRLGLVAWRAVQPAGDGLARLPRALSAVVKPVVLPPVLVGFLAPVASMAAAALCWIAITVATDSAFSRPAHVLVALGAGVAVGCAVWRWWPHRRDWRATVRAVLVGVVTVAAVVAGVVGWLDRVPEGVRDFRSVFVGLLTGFAVLTSLWSVAGFGLAGGGRRWRRVFLIGALPALLAVVLTLLFQVFVADPLGGWPAVLVVYLALALETCLLTKRFPDAPAGPDPAPTPRVGAVSEPEVPQGVALAA
ncbi:putative acylesterase/phospholipase RssA [Saccharothrix tamanrassetensis]|uniref:Putative acylesterase/phospholipase RssA n=1 Tax=Saccharothrix tamanrassetensis TaxID=1051531 RepID=A0A841CLU1_9PSEU|nr:DUF3376 domain-containing protein [Saccharothrix tamanrassetensis]MBB5957128.1 putative acylesterase/phospholipase RssA [Saccharothrix tamanrassetensis]